MATPEQAGTRTGLTRLRVEIASDRHALAGHFAEATAVLQSWVGPPPVRPQLVVAAVALHGWYTALEKIIERVAREIDREVPEGEAWHRALLSQSTIDLPGLRPAVLARAQLPALNELLAFRHFFRHAYAVELDADKLKLTLKCLAHVAPLVDAHLDAFDDFLQRVIERLSEPQV